MWRSPFLLSIGIFLVAPPTVEAQQRDFTAAEQRVHTLLRALSADSMEGRRTASPGYRRAALLVAQEMSRLGLTAGGDSGFYQRVPLIQSGRRYRVATNWAALDTVSPDRRAEDVNVVGILVGSDPTLRDQVLLVGAHLDHLGYGRAVNGDSLYNGADDDASGVVAVLGVAERLLAGPPPERTVVFVAFTGEEMGGLGSRWYLEHPVRPLAHTVAQFQIEMIARPDSLAGGSGKTWLTGYERSTMGERLASAGIPLVADPRPDQQFFRRSDNIRFALAGIPAHTLSSFNLHPDYHRPSDEVDQADIVHMTAVIDAAAEAVRLLASGPAPAWKPGGRPEARRRN